MSTNLLAASYPHALDRITGIGPLGNLTGWSSSFQLLETLISNIIGALTIITSLWFIYQIVLSGIAWISSNGDKAQLQTAQKRLTNSFLGLLISVAAYTVTGLIANFLGMPGIFDLVSTLYKLQP